MLLDNEEKQSYKSIRLVYHILFGLGLLYGAYIFANYIRIATELQAPNSFFPKYAATYIYGSQAFKGALLLSGLAIAHFVKLVHFITALVLLGVSLGLTFFAEQLYFLWVA